MLHWSYTVYNKHRMKLLFIITDNTQQVSEITAKETEGKYPLGVTKDRIDSIEVIVPKYFNQDSIIASEDSKDLITVSFSK